MSDITTLYTDKANHIYNCISDLHKLKKEKVDSFRLLTNFQEYIIGNVELINKFKNISGDICLFIDSRNFDIREISLLFDQIKAVKNIISQVETNINETKRLTNKHQKEVADANKIIDDCFHSMTFGTLTNYKTKLENANKQMQELCKNFCTFKQKLEDFLKEIQYSTELWSEDANKISNLTSAQINNLGNEDADFSVLEKEYEKSINRKNKDLDDLKKFMESENEADYLYRSDFQELKNKQKSYKEYESLLYKVNQKIDEIIAERERNAEEERLRKEEERLRKIREEEERLCRITNKIAQLQSEEESRKKKKIITTVGIVIGIIVVICFPFLLIGVIIAGIICYNKRYEIKRKRNDKKIKNENDALRLRELFIERSNCVNKISELKNNNQN